MSRAIVMKAGDNVATLLAAVQPGDRIQATGGPEVWAAVAVEAVELGHKIALAPIAAGDPILKYGEVIGYATAAIRTGEHVHVHNVVSGRGRQ
jgi:altronate dehydratase small subunit